MAEDKTSMYADNRADYIHKDTNAINDLLSALDQQYVITIQYKNTDPINKYTDYFVVKTKDRIGEEQRKVTLFCIYLYPVYKGHYFRVRFNKDLLSKFNLTNRFSYSNNQYEGSISEIKNKLVLFAESIKEDPDFKIFGEIIEKI